MGKISDEDLEFAKNLTAPFMGNEVRLKPGGRAGDLQYVTARTVENRLDNVAGPLNWWNNDEFTGAGVICRLTIRFPSGVEVTRAGGGGCSGTQDEEDNFKGAFSDAFKRAAVKFGIGRHLYGDGTPTWHLKAPAAGAAPAAPPRSGSAPRAPVPPQQPTANRQQREYPLEFNIPRNANAYFPWTKNLERHFQCDLIPFLDNFCDQLNVRRNSKEWTAEQARMIFAHMVEYLRTQPSYQGEFDHWGEPTPAGGNDDQGDDEIPF